MTFYGEMNDIAAELLSEFDQSRGTGAADDGLFYVQVTPGTGPVDAPGDPTETAFKLDAVARGVAFKYVDNSLIVQTDLQLTTPARPDVVPAVNGFIRMDGVQHKIVRVDNIPPCGETVAHRIFFRK